MGCATTSFLVLISLCVSLTTFNLITTIHRRTEHVEWTSETFDSDDSFSSTPIVKESKFHIAVTADGRAYNRWQMRVMYYWYKKQRGLPGSSEMGKFTRILHSGSPDDLVDEIPTFVVDPLPKGMDKNYVVLNRPWAIVQWLQMTTIEEEYILMAEPDHIFLRPLPNLGCGDYPAAFSFFYIDPSKHETIMRKFYPEEIGPLTDIDPIGNSPVIIKKGLLKKIAPTWLNVSLHFKYDPEADQALGWNQEMYAYGVASALHGVQHLIRKDFMIQPPFDTKIENKFILHYTYELDYNKKGVLTFRERNDWGFNKRNYFKVPPPRNLPMPPPGVPESVVTLVRMINEATANIPNWDSIR